MFPFWRVPEEVEVKQDFGHIGHKCPMFLNDIFLKVRLFIFYLKPFLDSPLSCELNKKKELIGGKPRFRSVRTWNWRNCGRDVFAPNSFCILPYYKSNFLPTKPLLFTKRVYTAGATLTIKYDCVQISIYNMLCVLLQVNIDFTPGIWHELYNTLCVSCNEEYGRHQCRRWSC